MTLQEWADGVIHVLAGHWTQGEWQVRHSSSSDYCLVGAVGAAGHDDGLYWSDYDDDHDDDADLPGEYEWLYGLALLAAAYLPDSEGKRLREGMCHPVDVLVTFNDMPGMTEGDVMTLLRQFRTTA